MGWDNYMMGSCHHLAAALVRTRGFTPIAIVGPYRGQLAVYHVAAMDVDGTAWDAQGPRRIQDLVDEQEAMDADVWSVSLSGERDIWRLAAPRDGLLNPIVDAHVVRAAEWVDGFLAARGLPAAKASAHLSWQDVEALERAADAEGEMPDLARATADPGRRRHP